MSWFSRWFGRRPRAARAGRRSVTGRLRCEALESREVPTVNFYGGNLLPHVEAQAVFLGSAWSTNPTAAAQTGTVNSFLGDLTGGAYMDALTRAGYNVGRGTASAGAVDNRALTSGSTISDASIQAYLKADINAGLVQAPDANRLYIVYVQPNVAVNLGGGQGTTQQGILGYHGAFAGPGGKTIRYAVIAYPGGTAHNTSMGTSAIDQLTYTTSHELAEAVTDPDVNYGRLGWYDPRRGEIGDITEDDPRAQVRLDGYLVQEMADKNDQLLAINVPPPVTPPVTPPTTPPTTPPSTPAGQVATTTTLTAGPVHHRGWWRPTTVDLTITITPTSGTAVPTGTVQLLFGSKVIGSAHIRNVNGVATATFTVALYGWGDFDFSAQYVGTSSFAGSTSNGVTVTV